MKCIFFAILCGLAIGCTESNPVGTREPADPTNTGVNVRDRDGKAKTSFDQNENQADINITADIRKQVVDTKMSVVAQNIKIVTQDGMVTLRGPVDSQREKERIGEIALDVAGANKVDNQLEIKN